MARRRAGAECSIRRACVAASTQARSTATSTATITAVTLRLKRGTLAGTSPFSTHGTCTVDIRTGGFGAGTAFAANDFEAAATASGVASMSNVTANGSWSTGSLNAAGRSAVNKTGRTQLRVYFTTDDNDDLGSDYVGFYSGREVVDPFGLIHRDALARLREGGVAWWLDERPEIVVTLWASPREDAHPRIPRARHAQFLELYETVYASGNVRVWQLRAPLAQRGELAGIRRLGRGA